MSGNWAHDVQKLGNIGIAKIIMAKKVVKKKNFKDHKESPFLSGLATIELRLLFYVVSWSGLATATVPVT